MIITQAGTYKLVPDKVNIPSGAMSIYLSGTLGGGTAKIVYQDDFGNYIPIVNGAIVDGEQKVIGHGYGIGVYLNVVGIGVNISVTAATVPYPSSSVWATKTPLIPYKFFRFTLLESGRNVISLTNVQIFDENVNVALHKPASMSSQQYSYQDYAYDANDNSYVTHCHTAVDIPHTDPAWWQVELTTAVPLTVYSLAIREDWDQDFFRAWIVEGSDDGTTWTQVDSRAGYTDAYWMAQPAREDTFYL